MQMPFCAIMRSWTLLAAFGGSYAPGITDACTLYVYIMLHAYMYMRLTEPVNVIFDRFASLWLC